MNILDMLFFIVIALITTLLATLLIIVSFGYLKIKRQNTQLSVDKVILFNRLNEIVNMKDDKSIEQTDGFIRFMSQSRDWAFDYIDSVQEAIKLHVDLADSVILNPSKTSVEFASKYSESINVLRDYLPDTEIKNLKN